MSATRDSGNASRSAVFSLVAGTLFLIVAAFRSGWSPTVRMAIAGGVLWIAVGLLQLKRTADGGAA